MAPLTLIAASAFASHASEPPVDFKPLLQDEGAPRLRRSNRLTALALLGALRCTKGYRNLPQGTGLYLASAQGNVDDITALHRQIVRDGSLPMPFDFINVSSNMAGFAVSQTLGLEGGNCAISRNGGAFDSALEMAVLDLEAGAVPMALVGVIEECAYPLGEHRLRLRVPPDCHLAEQSDWLLLTADAAVDGVGKLAGCRHYRSEAALRSRLQALSENGTQWVAAQTLPDELLSLISPSLIATVDAGYSESMCAHHLIRALAESDAASLAYLNSDGTGGYHLFEFVRHP